MVPSFRPEIITLRQLGRMRIPERLRNIGEKQFALRNSVGVQKQNIFESMFDPCSGG